MRYRFQILAAAVFFVAVCTSWAQSQPKLEFDAVSVKLSPPHGDSYMVSCAGGPGTADPTLFRCQNMSFTNLLSRAYKLNYDQIQGPDWLRTQMFEISARVKAGATPDQFRSMLENMLIDRFKLECHRETREIQVFDLVVAKSGSKLKEAAVADPTAAKSSYGDGGGPAPSGVDDAGYPRISPGGMAISSGHGRVWQPKWTTSALAGMLTGQLGRPVTDATGLTGQYDIDMRWITDSRTMQEDGPTLPQAVEEQLGLKLVGRKGPGEFLVIDHIEKLPTAN